MPHAPENYCTYTMKTLSLLFAIAGIICSWVGSRTCEFISFRDNDGNPPDDAQDPPFNRAIAADVGIFRYEITQYVNGGGTSGCVPYDDRWGQLQDYPSIATAQFCALFAPSIAAIAIFLNLLDFCVCNFPGSFIISAMFLLTSVGIQAGTFTLIADPVFCFEDSALDCSQGKGVYLSSAACVMFFLASCFLCCAPSADPFCMNFGKEAKPATKMGGPGSSGNTKTVVLQPVIIQTPEAPSGSNSKPYSKKKRRGNSMTDKV